MRHAIYEDLIGFRIDCEPSEGLFAHSSSIRTVDLLRERLELLDGI